MHDLLWLLRGLVARQRHRQHTTQEKVSRRPSTCARGRRARGQGPALPLTGCVGSGKSLLVSEPRPETTVPPTPRGTAARLRDAMCYRSVSHETRNSHKKGVSPQTCEGRLLHFHN